MNGQKHPRRIRWPAMTNAPQYVKARVGILTAKEVERHMKPVNSAWTAMCQGRATHLEWAIVAGAIEMSIGVERMGIVRGLLEEMTSAEAALNAISIRAHKNPAQTWSAPTLYGHEIEAIQTGLNLHKFQLLKLSWGEYDAAIQRAVVEVNAAGGKAVRVDDRGQVHMEAA